MVTEFTVFVLYTQLLVATPAGAAAGLLWTDDEVAQGFAWDEEVVGFGVPDHDGECLVRVDTAPAGGVAPVAADALWAVAVPFNATALTVSVGTVGIARALPVTPGPYRLVFQARPAPPPFAYRLHLTFEPDSSPGFAILKQGELGSAHVLRRRARRA